MKYDGKVLARVIRRRRLELNYSQDYVAGKLAMSQNAYSKMELGQTGITLGKFMVLCQALEIEVEALLGKYAESLRGQGL
ncbi:helix-turn-helix domain-containing protein [Mucilaginibacter psychrotolerans]|uniref:XRE family transcriptional regulator n=1 Tax=Mucilaginibacter psychrotolerans TaxID=1524096 RepID=A0A4Y8SDN4_9SPHI|nr:helix-turn-helix transcriptional regulator [Mucilaginibacter psychrotolerans]TFF37129.1 XRE family transcriptional regulator [Mucilaginibacter psychrotolerans]